MDKTGLKLGHEVQIHVCRLVQMGAPYNIRRKALGHFMKFTQLSIPYRFG